MSKWDLFVDESGSFNTVTDRGEKEHNIIGGFIIPHDIFNKELAAEWFQEVKNKVTEKIGAEKIRRINQYHPWYEKGSSAEHIDYDFTHACNNRFVTNSDYCNNLRDTNDTIRDTQILIVDLYRQKIEENGGYIVVFDEPTATDFGGNLGTYLSIMGKGIVILYTKLQDLTNEYAPELFLHIARRPNQEKNISDVVILQGHNIYDIDETMYQATLKYMAFALADRELTQIDAFSSIFSDNSNKIIIEDDGQGVITIPCDFICNTYYRGYRSTRWSSTVAFIKTYTTDRSIIIPIMDVNKVEVSEIIEMGKNRNYFEMFIRLEQQGFQHSSMRKFFEIFNRADIRDQKAFVKDLEQEFQEPVARSAERGTMTELIKRIDAMLHEFSDQNVIDEGIRNLLKANLYLYQQALYTHLGSGNKIEELEIKFQECTAGQTPYPDEVNELVYKNFNLRIVDYTDCFKYGKAEELFYKLKEAQEWKLEGIRFFLRPESARSPEFGREIGSYLMMMTYRLHGSTKDYCEKVRQELRDLEEIAIKQFNQSDDLCRCYQNICGLEMELGDYERSFKALYCSALYFMVEDCPPQFDDTTISEEECKYILRAAGLSSQSNAQKANPWIGYHYIRLLSQALKDSAANESAAKISFTMYASLDVNTLNSGMFSWIRNDFLFGIIHWRAAQICTMKGLDNNNQIASLYRKAIDVIGSEGSSAKTAISIAIHSGLISHLLSSDNYETVRAECMALRKEYDEFLMLNDSINGNNPFLAGEQNENIALEGYCLPAYEKDDNPGTIIDEFLALLKNSDKLLKREEIGSFIKDFQVISNVIPY